MGARPAAEVAVVVVVRRSPWRLPSPLEAAEVAESGQEAAPLPAAGAGTAHRGCTGSGAPEEAAPINDAITVPCASQSASPSPKRPIT